MNQNNSKTEVMKLHDYIPFYVGATLHYGSGRFIIKGFHFTKSHADKLTVFVIDEDGDEDSLPIDENSRIELRALSDISHDEKEEFIEVAGLEPEDIDCLIKTPDDFFQGELSFGTAHLTNIAQWAQGVKYLLSKHFDLFNLIENNLAIDKTTLK